MLKTIMLKKNTSKLYMKIDSMRVLHEQLCAAVKYFEDFFGVQVKMYLLLCSSGT